jgi:hypothetical protein
MTKPPGLYLHPRAKLVNLARAEWHVLIAQFCDDHGDLTDIELATIMAGAAELPLKYALRMERHGTHEKKADEE